MVVSLCDELSLNETGWYKFMSKKPEWLDKRGRTSSGGGYAPIEASFQPISKHRREVCQEVDDAPSLDYEYCFEIAGGEAAFQQHVGCAFVIKPTKSEGRLARWEKTESDRVVRYRILASKNEPKELVVSVAERSMGISSSSPIRLSPKDSTTDVLDAYVPLYPCLEIDETDEEWLACYGTKINIPELVEAAKKEYKPLKSSTIVSDTNSGLGAKTEKIHHVQFNPDTQQCETWSEIAAQYEMAPRALLALNPRFDADPLSLGVGDELVVALGN